MADDPDKFPVALTVAICASVAAVIASYLLYIHFKRAEGLDFAERLAHATRAARAIAPDAELARASINYVSSSGRVELPVQKTGTADFHKRGIVFDFRSPRIAGKPGPPDQLGRPTWGNGPGAGCIIELTAGGPGTRGADNMRVRQRDDSTPGCGESIAAGPRCSLAQVWAIAIARGAPQDALADILFKVVDAKPRWKLTITDWSRIGASALPDYRYDIPDDCTPE
jgi:hypothetical protein